MENKNCDKCFYKEVVENAVKDNENEFDDFKYSIVEICMDDGREIILNSNCGRWDDYEYDGVSFIVFNDGTIVGIYSMNHIISVILR